MEYEKEYEERITKHIHDYLSFAIIPKIYDRTKRDRIEAGLISSLNLSDKKTSSKHWLGNHHPDERIRNAKIWNIEYLNHKPLSLKEFQELVER